MSVWAVVAFIILKWGEGDWGPVEDQELNLGHVEFEVPWRSQNEDDK